MSKSRVIEGEHEKLSSQADKMPAKQEDLLTPPPQPVQSDVPVDDRRYIRSGILFLLLTLGGFSLWAGFVPLSSALISSGEVMVDSYRKSIQHYEGGIVKNILVRNGDKVAAGDPLIQLDTTQWDADRDATQKRLLNTQAELERLRAQQRFDTNLTFSDNLLQEAKKSQDISNVLKQQRQLHTASMSAFMQEQQALGARVEQINQQVSGYEQQRSILEQQITSLDEEQKAFDTLFKEGLGDGQRARELNRQLLQRQNEKARNESEIARLKLQATEAELQQATRKQDFLKEIGERIKQTQADYFDLQERIRVAEDKVRRATIRAPEKGIVVDLQVHTLGSVATPGQTLLDLVPEKDKFVVEAKVMTQDINELYKGQLADIRFSAFNHGKTKVIEGEVVLVSADRLVNERDGMPYYLARIRVTDKGYSEMDESMQLKPGMPAEVMIRRGDRTLFSYLLKPLADSFARGLKE
ncbi:HlyD family type I secretion periplasmic adaptor subunit [Oceanospirillum beijerinckii]|uniref:HlyD family type I secretion periplasmic adaptor subunit n=1 Tax=Oceanospirillum beijerinckii TaxID=64976 RepID=UPI0004296899|nr:HlyD family type I secretion periplasmic adaptor subunit [Oceanospirillum beijerinckii]